MVAAAKAWRDARWRDLALAGVLTIVAQAEVWTTAGLDGPRWACAFITLAITVPLFWRRRWPVAVGAVTVGATVLSDILWEVAGTIATPAPAITLAAYSVGAHASDRRAAYGLAIMLLELFAGSLVDGRGPGDSAFIGALVVGVWLAGRTVRSRRALAAQLADYAARVEDSRDADVAAAAASERARIARELHDVVAHCVNVMVLEAGAERRAIGDERPQTTGALQGIEDTGRQALDELRRLLGIVRAADGAPLAPQPTLDALPALVEQTTAAGVPTTLRVDGDVRPLSPGLELSAYRIVQEALTNTRKHAGARAASVTVRYRPDALQIDVTDDGKGTAAGSDGTGHGLIGMRERVALFGGTVEARGTEDGFLVSARLLTG